MNSRRFFLEKSALALAFAVTPQISFANEEKIEPKKILEPGEEIVFEGFRIRNNSVHNNNYQLTHSLEAEIEALRKGSFVKTIKRKEQKVDFLDDEKFCLYLNLFGSRVPKERTQKNPATGYTLYLQQLEYDKIVLGVEDFCNQNCDLGKTVEKETGVSAKALFGITGVETCFGKNLGEYEVLGATTSQYLAAWKNKNPRFQKRAKYVYTEATTGFIAHCNFTGRELFYCKGSSSGAIGWTQIMGFNLKDLIDSKRRDPQKLEHCLEAAADHLLLDGWDKNDLGGEAGFGARNKIAIRKYNGSGIYAVYYMKAVDNVSRIVDKHLTTK